MNNKREIHIGLIIIIICLIPVSPFISANAGNREMVETRTQEMDDLNKQMVGQIPDLPKDGKVDAKARVTNESGKINFDIYHVKTAIKEESLNFGEERQEKQTKEILLPDTAKEK